LTIDDSEFPPANAPTAAISQLPQAPPPTAEGLDGLRALAVAANDAIAVLQHAIREFERQLAHAQQLRAAAVQSEAKSEPVAIASAPSGPVASAIVPAAPPTTSAQPSTVDSPWDGEKRRRRVAVAVVLSVFAAGFLAALIRAFG
jgi:hypothetical protein